MADAGADRYPMFPVHALLRDRDDSLSRAPNITTPTWITHGTADSAIPVGLGRQLAEAISGATYVERPGKDHVNVVDSATYDAVAAFVKGG